MPAIIVLKHQKHNPWSGSLNFCSPQSRNLVFFIHPSICSQVLEAALQQDMPTLPSPQTPPPTLLGAPSCVLISPTEGHSPSSMFWIFYGCLHQVGHAQNFPKGATMRRSREMPKSSELTPLNVEELGLYYRLEIRIIVLLDTTKR